MAEIELKDFLPKEVIEAPIKLDKNMQLMLRTLQEVINTSKQQATALEKAHSTTDIKKMVDALTKEQAELKKVNHELQLQVAVLKEGHSAQQKQIDQLNDLEGALNDVSGGLGGAITRVRELTKAALVFIATPIGLVIAAIGAALFALISYFKGSEEGQNRLNKIVRVGQAIFEQFMNVVEAVGKAIFEAFDNPGQAIKDFGKLLLDQVLNRIKGIFLLIPRLAQAIDELISGNFKKAGKIAFDAFSQIGTGVENMSDKIQKGINKINELVEAGILSGNKIADLEAKYDKASRDLIIKRAETEAKIQKIREEAAGLEGEARKNALLQAIKLERELGAEEVRVAQINLALQKEFVKAHGDDKNALMAVAEATAAVADARAKQYRDTVRFAREIARIDEQERNHTLKQLERINKYVDREVEATNQLLSTKQQEIDIRQRFNDRIAEDEKKMQENLTQTEKEAADQRRRIRQQEFREMQEEGIELLDQIAGVYGHFEGVIGSILDNLTGNRLEQIDREEEATISSYERQIEAAGENVERRTQLENAMEAKKAELDRRRAAATRKNAIFEKAVNVAQAVMLTAKAVLEYGIITPLAFAAAAAGAIQIGIILGTKIPAYAKGTKKHSGGPALVGEEGTEAIVFPNDKVQLSPDGPTVMDLPAGSAVLTHKETMKFLALTGLQRPSDRKEITTINLEKYFQELNYTIKNKKETHYNWTRRGLERSFQNGESRRYFLDRFYR